jgi:type VI secretion system Hcp family effector
MYEFYVTIIGARQGRFPGEAPSGPHEGKLVGLAYDQASITPAAGSGAGSGTRRGRLTLQPVRFTKEWGAASPALLAAIGADEALTAVVFEFVSTSDDGVQEVFHRVTLAEARIVELRPFVDLDAEPSSLMPLPPLEEVAIAYAGITVENLAHGTSASAGTVGKGRGAAPKRAAAKTATRARPAAKARARR